MAATFLVIGLGQFGSNLALRLMDFGNEVMAVDMDEELVSRVAPYVTQAKIADCMEEQVLRSLGPESFDFCFVCIGERFQTSLEITSQLKDMGAPMVIAKADRELHARLLKKIGADEVVLPERDMAQRIAMRYSVNGALEYIELSPGYAIFELDVPGTWIGKTLRELDIRGNWNVNVIACKENGMICPITDAAYSFQPGTHILVAGSGENVARMMEAQKSHVKSKHFARR